MSSDYKVLYRKYRPTNFNEVVGQKFTIKMLRNAVLQNKVSHAYIFTGPRGTGKTSTAKIFAKTINCEALVDGNPCGECNSCLNINNSADIIEIDAASNNGVDEIRELINNVKIAPSFSRYKVYIIDEVHMLTQSAFNALLLTLEEPPAHIVFVLATTNIENVPITILSRCQRYDFKKITDIEIVEHLKLVCEKEKIVISDEAIKEIAYLSDGGLRDALSILNQLSTSSLEINLDTVLDNYGSVSLVKIKKIITEFLANNYEKLKNIFDSLSNSSVDYKIFIKKLVDELFLEAINLKTKGHDEGYSSLKKIVWELNDLINKININIDPFVLIFMIFVENMTIIEEGSTDINVKSSKVKENMNEEKEEKKLVNKSLNVSITENEDYLKKLQNVRVNNCFCKADKLQLEIFKSNWLKFIESSLLENELKNLIIDCEVVLASQEINILIHNQTSVVQLLNNNIENIEKKYQEILGISLKFVVVSLNEWNNLKKDYIKKIKDGFKYVYQDEPKKENLNIDLDKEENLLSDEIISIFEESKLEIK